MSPEAQKNDFDIIIIGAGLAGLVNSILLSRAGFNVLLLEKKEFPFHKVCGEYVSNEVLPFLQSLGFHPHQYGATSITKLRISDPEGNQISSELDLGGFGISRFTMDKLLSEIAGSSGVTLLEKTRVLNIEFAENKFLVSTSEKTFKSAFVIGSYGKRELLDKKLNRSFINRHTGYMGVKYHIKTKYPDNEIGLDNFPGGYCGIVKIEDDKYNLCYLYKRNLKDEVKSIREIEEKVMFKNPVLKNIFTTSEFLFSKPEVINEISFNKKSCIENRIFLCGDSAGLITPLCGNGMAMAIHAAKILSEVLIQHSSPGKIPELSIRDKAEAAYRSRWNAQFRERLFWGRNLQMISGNATITKSALKIMHAIPKLEKWLIKKTHGSTIS